MQSFEGVEKFRRWNWLSDKWEWELNYSVQFTRTLNSEKIDIGSQLGILQHCLQFPYLQLSSKFSLTKSSKRISTKFFCVEEALTL